MKDVSKDLLEISSNWMVNDENEALPKYLSTTTTPTWSEYLSTGVGKWEWVRVLEYALTEKEAKELVYQLTKTLLLEEILPEIKNGGRFCSWGRNWDELETFWVPYGFSEKFAELLEEFDPQNTELVEECEKHFSYKLRDFDNGAGKVVHFSLSSREGLDNPIRNLILRFWNKEKRNQMKDIALSFLKEREIKKNMKIDSTLGSDSNRKNDECEGIQRSRIYKRR
ncbi:hypothetical protein [Pectobacterium brasiliense]|uniref:hypothetical protein n=1 Tax=Pectobacterium brasiliense TaxID=180957 RepID=UPI0032EC5CE7